MAVKNVVVLGATGSIGDSTLDVIRRHPDKFNVSALSARQNVAKPYSLCVEFKPNVIVIETAVAARELAASLKQAGIATEVKHGEASLSEIAGATEVDVVVTGIVGAAGLLSTIAAVAAGKRVLIANKEPLVMLGREIVSMAGESGAEIIPLDSEHNALFQCLPDSYRVGKTDGFKEVRRVLLTGSGGPLRQLSMEEMARVTPGEAIAHPNWSMGPKISVDSATLMNKGLELIEACCLFSIAPQHVEVVIHPQSTIHSMIEYCDGSILAQMGCSDMRIPIAHGLGWPERIESGAANLDFSNLRSLDFEAPDLDRFPCLRLAIEAAQVSGTAPTILNAANEVAVDSFLNEKIPFTAISQIIESTLNAVAVDASQNLDNVLAADHAARQFATASIQKYEAGRSAQS